MDNFVRTVSLPFPTLAEEKPCINARPAGILCFLLSFGSFLASFLFSFSPLVSSRGFIISRLARLRSRRSVSPVTSVNSGVPLMAGKTYWPYVPHRYRFAHAPCESDLMFQTSSPKTFPPILSACLMRPPPEQPM
jgi:hypothetical protein